MYDGIKWLHKHDKTTLSLGEYEAEIQISNFGYKWSVFGPSETYPYFHYIKGESSTILNAQNSIVIRIIQILQYNAEHRVKLFASIKILK